LRLEEFEKLEVTEGVRIWQSSEFFLREESSFEFCAFTAASNSS
jgi:hypothetical protein